MPGLRVTIAVHEGKGVLARLTKVIAEMGGNIISVVTFGGDQPADRLITIKISDCDAAAVRAVLDQEGLQIIDFRSA